MLFLKLIFLLLLILLHGSFPYAYSFILNLVQLVPWILDPYFIFIMPLKNSVITIINLLSNSSVLFLQYLLNLYLYLVVELFKYNGLCHASRRDHDAPL